MVSRPQIKFGVKRWRNIKIMWGLMLFELPLTIALLVLFGVADPNTYKTLLWQDGFDNGFNSSPDQPIYNLDNGGSYTTPLVWSQFLTQFNVVAVVLSMFVLITKSILIVLKWFPTLLSLIAHLILLGLYSFSVHGQTSPDTIDPAHQNHGVPWFIKYSCSVAKLKSDVGWCQQAKASFYLTVIMLVIFVMYVVVALHSILFSPDPEPELDEEEDDFYKPGSSKGKERGPEAEFGMVPIPMTPGSAMFPMTPLSPMTPRTKAFTTLEGVGSSKRMPSFPPPPTEETKKKKKWGRK